MKLGRSMSLKAIAASLGVVFFVSLSGCDTIPVLDTSKIHWPEKMPWQQSTNNNAPPPVQSGNNGLNLPPVTNNTQGDYVAYPEMRTFIGDMQRKHKFDVAYLENTLFRVKRSDEVLAKVRAPAEAKPWRSYRPIFMTEDRIRGGLEFWDRNAQILDAAYREYGVEPEYVIAIIGVETNYGRNVGSHNVLQSLTTLAFDYPARASFYRKELEQFLLLTREEKIRPDTLTGSYAGAMGISQFISSSYRNYAVDFNRDNHKDLWRPSDAIGSVANYLAKHKWKKGGDVATPARITGTGFNSMVDTTAKKPRFTLAQLSRAGVTPIDRFYSDKVSLIKLIGGRSTEYWIGGNNFYAITRYNHSPKYAMAVHQLAQEIRHRRYNR